MRAYDRVIAALVARGARRHGNNWTCPSHDDAKPSLSVTDGGDKALLFCHAGCDKDDVAAALGLAPGDLFDEPPEQTKRIVAAYPYEDEGGNLLYEVVRFDPKGFRQRRPDGYGGDVWNLNGTRRVLYRLPDVIRTARKGGTVFVVEGEKDVHAIEQAGGVATCNSGGAGKWRQEYAAALKGADVIVITDKDEPGLKHARQVVDSLGGIAADVRLVEPAEGKDAADHLAAGHGLDEFVPVVSTVPVVTTVPKREAGTVNVSDVHPIKIDWLWPDRIPQGMVTVFTGPPKVGKSTILYDLAARLSREGHRTLVLTAEDHLAAVVRPRLEAAGADLTKIEAVTDEITLPDDGLRINGWIEKFGFVMAMIDPLVAFVGDGINTHRDHHVRRVLAPLASIAEATNAAIVVVVHTNKGMGNDPLARVSGSVGFTGAARSIVVAADDPQDDSRKIFGVAGTNLAEHAPPLAYRIVGVEAADGITTSKIEWLGEAPEVDIRELLAQRDPEDRLALEEAIEFLRTSGAMDEPQLVKELVAEAGARGISDKTLQRARRALGLPVSKPTTFGGPRYWGPSPDKQSGHHHPLNPVQTVQTEPDLHKRTVETPSPDSPDKQMGLGEEPDYIRIQRELGETPPASDAEALANVMEMFPDACVIGTADP